MKDENGERERQRENKKHHEKWLRKIASDVDGLVTKISNIIQFSSFSIRSLSSPVFLFWPSFLSTSRVYSFLLHLYSEHTVPIVFVLRCVHFIAACLVFFVFFRLHRFAKHKVIKSKIQRSTFGSNKVFFSVCFQLSFFVVGICFWLKCSFYACICLPRNHLNRCRVCCVFTYYNSQT